MATPEVERGPRPGYGSGVFRRRIVLRGRPGLVRGGLEDDFHHFGVEIRHDGRCVIAAEGRAERFPWATCPGAVDPLRALVGLPLSRRPGAARGRVDPRSQCTHLLDLAGLAVALAAAGGERRAYAVEVPDRIGNRTRPRLARDGAPLLAWQVEAGRIVSPAPFTGQPSFGGGFTRWAERELDPDLAEAAVVLQRACGIALGRVYDMDSVAGAVAFGPMTGHACYTFGPERVEHAHRMRGSARDFSRTPEELLTEEPA